MGAYWGLPFRGGRRYIRGPRHRGPSHERWRISDLTHSREPSSQNSILVCEQGARIVVQHSDHESRPLWRGSKTVERQTGLSERQVRRLLGQGLPHLKIGGALYFEPDQVWEWIRAHRRGTTS